jgi:8-oxo-dGTP pyrophosphatase MutT (NUDIX family)
VIVIRDGTGGPELLMVQRTPRARFMAGHWVFPGGAVDPADGEGQPGLRAAAVRELEEEAAVVLSADAELVPFARWITPAQSPIRFDTWFYLAAAPAGAAQPRVDGVEIVDFRWLTAADALAAGAAGGFVLALPTEKQLELLGSFGSAAQAIASARERVDEIRPIEPRIEGSGPSARIVLD